MWHRGLVWLRWCWQWQHTARKCDIEGLAVCGNVDSDYTTRQCDSEGLAGCGNVDSEYTTRQCDSEGLAVCADVDSDSTPQDRMILRLWLSAVMLLVTAHYKKMWQWGFGCLWWYWRWQHTTRQSDIEDLAVCCNVDSDCTQQVNVTLLHTTRVCDMEDLAVCVNVDSDCTQQDNVTLTLWLSMVMLSDCTQQDNVTLTLWLSVVMLTVNVHNKTYTTRQCDTDFLAVCGDVDSDRHVHYTTTRWEIIEPRRDILNLYPVVSGADSWRFTQPCTLWGILLDRASLIVYGPDGYLCNCW